MLNRPMAYRLISACGSGLRQHRPVPSDGIGERGGITRLDQVPIGADLIGNATHARRDDGQARHQGLGDHRGERLAVGGQDEKVGGTIEVHEFRGGFESEEVDAVGDAHAGRQRGNSAPCWNSGRRARARSFARGPRISRAFSSTSTPFMGINWPTNRSRKGWPAEPGARLRRVRVDVGPEPVGDRHRLPAARRRTSGVKPSSWSDSATTASARLTTNRNAVIRRHETR